MVENIDETRVTIIKKEKIGKEVFFSKLSSTFDFFLCPRLA